MTVEPDEEFNDYVWIVWHHSGASIFGDGKTYVATFASESAARGSLKSHQFFTKEAVK